jgi:hypothetical protein
VSDDIVTIKLGERRMHVWAVKRLVNWAAGKGNEQSKEGLKAELDELTAELAGPTPTPIERVLAETAAISWFALRLHEAQFAGCATSEGGLTIRQSEHQQRRIDHAHRRLISTIRTLATVRRLAVPALQINLAHQQFNQLNAGETS